MFREVWFMQMLCKVSNVFSDVRCPVCGQGFLVYWTRVAAREREEHRQSLMEGLRVQHGTGNSADAHPAAFHLPDGVTSRAPGEAPALPMPALLGMYS